MWKSLSSLGLLALAGCLSPGMGEMSSNESVEAAAETIGERIVVAQRSAMTNQVAQRVIVSPEIRSVWISSRRADGSFVPIDGELRRLEDRVSIEQVTGMAPQPDGTYALTFPPSGEFTQRVIVRLADREGSRRRLEYFPKVDPMPRIVNPAEDE